MERWENKGRRTEGKTQMAGNTKTLIWLEIGKNLFWGCSKRFEAMHNAISSAWMEDFESLGFWSWCHGKNVCICLPTLVEVAEFAHQKRNVAFLSTVPVGGMVCVGDWSDLICSLCCIALHLDWPVFAVLRLTRADSRGHFNFNGGPSERVELYKFCEVFRSSVELRENEIYEY